MKRVVILCNLLLCLYCASAQDAAGPGYLDPSKPTEQRVADLIGRMTLEEKAQQLNHLNVGIPRLKVAAWGGWNQTLHGVWSKQPFCEKPPSDHPPSGWGVQLDGGGTTPCGWHS